MYSWAKYVAFALIALLFGCFLYDVVKVAKKRGGTWKSILLWILVWILIFAAVITVNCWINKDWVPGKWFIIINPF